MATGNSEMNMFLVHSKNSLCINSCISGTSAPESKVDNAGDDSARSEVAASYSSSTLWSLNRAARCYSRSPNNTVAIVDDRLGLSILHVKTDGSSEFAFDTLRGVGKFRNLYTPIGCKNIRYLQWSDNGVYLVIYFNLSNCAKEPGIAVDENLHIWDITQQCIVGSFCTRRMSPEQWPIIKWVGPSDNFVYCYGQQVSLYAITSPEGTYLKTTRLLLSIPIPRVFSVEVFYHENEASLLDGMVPSSDDEGTLVHAVTESVATMSLQTAPGLSSDSDTPGTQLDSAIKGYISIAAYTKADIANQVSGNLRICTIRCMGGDMFRVSSYDHELKTEDYADMLWSPSGKYLLVLGQSTVDLAGEKYGSTSNCLLYRATGAFICRVNTNTIHDARWCPTRDEFILMEGNMPCDITLYNTDCIRLFEFPKMYRNTIKWNPLGNMVALCGFGNLAGEICFWYRKDNGEYEQIVQFKEPCTVISEWSYDARYFITASTFPRMKVDNCIKIFSHEADLLDSKTFDECYGVCWIKTPETSWSFVRPRVRKSAGRKAVYRPKILPKDDMQRRVSDVKDVDPDKLSRNVDPGSWNVSPALASANAHTMRDNGYRGSLFSNDYGDKNDPNVDLLDAFRHVFSLQQNGHVSTQLVPTEPPVPHFNNRVPVEPMVSEKPPDRRTSASARGTGVKMPPEDAAKSLSMLMHLKKQMQGEKSKPLQQTILDEVQLLKLLLEAKNRSVNRTRVE
ncbi:Eukaryotic translation initiation factor eIF2A family protein [Babesia bovis T2Bo]|uniref:Translation initiation factor beta propellor-like domain-containing protein n=1 Tax=Babesia bovis TaxID=5865 RepID=A7ANE6_BABBO|nr:Eukaryotic translation initiation factor eIF2A family protein [Babesia bovis T2Bo]EDO08080.1 Eukaryotic translation initiation factor eIF2A family protein [Babesia bovis T2Bo]|eukprot:XP_001611648.1 hypothetical protein [Babesia bovis T2Bo]